jgi:hypothetical protein
LRWLARAEPNVEKAQIFVRRVVTDARRAAEIVDRIRAMATRGTVRQTEFKLADIVIESMAFLQKSAEASRLQAPSRTGPSMSRFMPKHSSVGPRVNKPFNPSESQFNLLRYEPFQGL